MKLLIVFLLCLSSLFASSQTTVAGKWKYYFLRSDSAFTMPLDTLASAPAGSIASKNDVSYFKLSTGVWVPATGDIPENAFGYRYNKSSWSNLSDWIVNGSSASVVSNNIRMTGGAADYTKSIYLNDPTCLEHWDITTRFTADSVGAGIAVGKYTFNFLGANTYEVAKFNTGTGQLSLGLHSTGSPTVPLYFINATGTVSFSGTDTLELYISQQGDISYASIRNITQHTQKIFCTYTYNFNNLSGMRAAEPNNSRIGIWNLGGNVSVKSLGWYIYDPVHAKIMVVGDSKAQDFTTFYDGRFSGLLNEQFGTTINSAGSGDGAVDVVTRTNEIVSMKPEKLLLSIGSNDLRHAIPNLLANYDTIVNRATRAGIDVYHQLGFYEPALDQSLLVNHIIATYPASKIIDCLTPTQQAGILIDGAHGTDEFHRIVFSTIMNSGKLSGARYRVANVIRNQSQGVQDATFAIDGPGTFKGQLTKVVINNTFPSLNADPIFDIQNQDSSVYRIDKYGRIQHRPDSAGVLYSVRVPSRQYPNPFYQAQDSTGAPMFEMRTNTKYSLFIGVNSGINNAFPASAFSAGAQNVGIGGPAGFSRSPLQFNTTGLNNVAIGGAALGANTTGSFGTAVGCNALLSNTVAFNNTAVGQAALAFDTSGGDNTAIGFNSLRNVTNSIENVGIGSFSNWNNATGSGNTSIGIRSLAFSGGQSTIVNTSNNTAIGWQAGWLSTMGSQNIILGYNSHVSSVIGSSNVFIGSQQTASGSVNNTALIGDSMSTSISNIVGIGKASQNVIIGVTAISVDKAFKLQVEGSARIKDSLLIGNIPNGTSSDSALVVENGVIHKIKTWGVYTPTITLGSNVSSATSSQLQYSVQGNVCTVSGLISTTITTGGVGASIFVPLPVASTFSSVSNCGGGAGTPASLTGTIYIQAATGGANKIEFDYNPTLSGSFVISFSATYLIQ